MTKPLSVSLARRFATMAALLAGIAMLGVAGASWWLIKQEHAASLRSLLKKDAELQATTVGDNLREIAGRMSELANSSLIANALLDSHGRERYLIPFLNGIQRIHGIPVDILFTDFAGSAIARNGNASFSEQELSWLREKLPAGQPASRVQIGEDGKGGEDLLAVEFIVLSRANSVEGAFLYRIQLDRLELHGGARLLRGKEDEQLLHSPTAITAAVKVPPIYQYLDFFVLTNPAPSALSVDWQRLGLFFILAVGLVLTVIMLGLHFGKRLTRDLGGLEFFARGIAEKGFGTGRAEAADSLEVAGLAQSINRMLEHLQQEQDEILRLNASLEERVQQRTEELQSQQEELRQSNEELEEKNKLLADQKAEVEAANKELESFSYSVSHDLRAPLRGIDGFSQALLEDYAAKLDDQGKDYLQRVRAGTQRMGALIDDMLNLARVTRAPMQRTLVDLSALAAAIVGELRQTQPERAVEVVVQPGLVADGDVKQLRVLLTNLLANAWKFTGKQERARIEFGMQPNGGVSVYFVRDNGAGFDMTYVGKLFGAFQRLHTPAEFPGIGIGLATVLRIVRRHNGRAWAEGAVEQGATFFFTLAPESAPAQAMPNTRREQ